MQLRRGPVFTNLLLADEINRAPAKTQAALLEVMQERQVTIEGESLPVPTAVHGARDAEPDRAWKAPTRCPRRSSTASCSRCGSTIRATAEEIALARHVTRRQGRRRDARLDACAARSRRPKTSRGCRPSPRRSRWTSACSTTRCGSRAPRATGPASRSARGRAAASRWCARRARRRCSTGRDFVTPDDVKSMARPALRHRVSALARGRARGAQLRPSDRGRARRVPAPRA